MNQEDSRIRILFVDDEENILRAMKRSLRDMRDAWDVYYLTSGRQGLDLLREHPFDMVISDMYMPEMNGAAFLQEVRNHYPGIIRIILSGHSDHELILKTIIPAHAFLHKPYSKDDLVSLVGKIQQFKKLITQKRVRDTITEIGTLPSQPIFYPLMNMALEREGHKEIADILSYDTAMAANVLKVVLNSFLCEIKKLPSLEEAASIIGKETLSTLVNTPDLFLSYHDMTHMELPIYALWRHGFRTARYAAAIAAQETAGRDAVNMCFMAGLLHDIGKYILMLTFEEEYLELLAMRKQSSESEMARLEIATFGATHGTVGAYLMSLWGIPLRIAQGIAFHHTPEMIKSPDFSPVIAVHVANAMDHYLQNNLWGNKEEKLNQKFFDRMDQKTKLKEWIHSCIEVNRKDKIVMQKLVI
jgi:HD-like signal output (HDOD) protein